MSIDVGGEFDIVVEPERLKWNGIGFEIVKHAGNIVKPQVLDVTATFVHSHTQVLEWEGGRERERERERAKTSQCIQNSGKFHVIINTHSLLLEFSLKVKSVMAKHVYKF